MFTSSRGGFTVTLGDVYGSHLQNNLHRKLRITHPAHADKNNGRALDVNINVYGDIHSQLLAWDSFLSEENTPVCKDLVMGLTTPPGFSRAYPICLNVDHGIYAFDSAANTDGSDHPIFWTIPSTGPDGQSAYEIELARCFLDLYSQLAGIDTVVVPTDDDDDEDDENDDEEDDVFADDEDEDDDFFEPDDDEDEDDEEDEELEDTIVQIPESDIDHITKHDGDTYAVHHGTFYALLGKAANDQRRLSIVCTHARIGTERHDYSVLLPANETLMLLDRATAVLESADRSTVLKFGGTTLTGLPVTLEPVGGSGWSLRVRTSNGETVVLNWDFIQEGVLNGDRMSLYTENDLAVCFNELAKLVDKETRAAQSVPTAPTPERKPEAGAHDAPYLEKLKGLLNAENWLGVCEYFGMENTPLWFPGFVEACDAKGYGQNHISVLALARAVHGLGGWDQTADELFKKAAALAPNCPEVRYYNAVFLADTEKNRTRSNKTIAARMFQGLDQSRHVAWVKDDPCWKALGDARVSQLQNLALDRAANLKDFLVNKKQELFGPDIVEDARIRIEINMDTFKLVLLTDDPDKKWYMKAIYTGFDYSEPTFRFTFSKSATELCAVLRNANTFLSMYSGTEPRIMGFSDESQIDGTAASDSEASRYSLRYPEKHWLFPHVSNAPSIYARMHECHFALACRLAAEAVNQLLTTDDITRADKRIVMVPNSDQRTFKTTVTDTHTLKSTLTRIPGEGPYKYLWTLTGKAPSGRSMEFAIRLYIDANQWLVNRDSRFSKLLSLLELPCGVTMETKICTCPFADGRYFNAELFADGSFTMGYADAVTAFLKEDRPALAAALREMRRNGPIELSQPVGQPV